MAELESVLPAAEAIVAQLSLVRLAINRITMGDVESRPLWPVPAVVAQYFRAAIGFSEREELRVLFLNSAHRLISESAPPYGSAVSVSCRPRWIIKHALEHNASAIILAHNHPSGDPTPSEADLRVTRKLQDVARGVDIALLDHMIVTARGWISLRAEGLI